MGGEAPHAPCGCTTTRLQAPCARPAARAATRRRWRKRAAPRACRWSRFTVLARAWARAPPVQRRGALPAEGAARSGAHGGGSTRRRRDAAKAAPPSIWETLGITARATAEEFNRAFRQRALATHPDRGGDAEAFREVQRAFKEAQRRIARRRRHAHPAGAVTGEAAEQLFQA